MTESSLIRVWDPLVRFFHWALVSAFTIAYITEEDFLTVHSWAGYLILMLLCIRLAWGFLGTRYARFSDFLYSPKKIIQFLKDTSRLNAKRYLGHNPAGGAMVLLLMFSLLITTTSGVILLGAEEQAGPLVLVFVHVAGVLVESLIHKENLVSAMITGLKPGKTSLQLEDKS
jgi:cytochrome b